MSLPQHVADHGDERRRGVGVVRVDREARAECRAKAQHLEIVAGDVGRGAALRVRLARAGVEDDIGRRPRGDVAEQRPLRRVLPVLWIREFAADRPTRPGAIDAADPDERFLPRDARHRTADERLDEQEQRGAEADAEREDPDHRRRGDRRAREVAGREAQVLNRVVDQVHASHVPARFLRLLDAAEGARAQPGAPVRAPRRGRHPPPRAGRCGRGSRRRAPARRERGGRPIAVEAAEWTAGAAAASLQLLQLDDARDGAGESFPVGHFPIERAPAGTRERVELGAAAGIGDLPRGGQPALVLELVEGWIERAFADLQHVAGHLLQALGDRPAVQRPERDDFEKQQVERALHEIRRSAHTPRLPRL